MNRWLLVVLALFATRAGAYTFECVPGLYGTQIGSVSTGKLGTDGQWLLFFCKTPDGVLHAKSLYCTGARCTRDLDVLASNMRTISSSADPAAAIKTVASLLVFDEPECKDVAGGTQEDRVCLALEDDMFNRWPAGWVLPARLPPRLPAPPPAARWIVASVSICSTVDKDAGGRCIRRQSFTWDGFTRGAVAQPERALIGSDCVPTIGASPYFGFTPLNVDGTISTLPPRSDRVVQCQKL